MREPPARARAGRERRHRGPRHRHRRRARRAGEGLPRRRPRRARRAPLLRAARRSAPTRSPPTCACATSGTRANMQPAADAVQIDTTELEVDEVVERIEALVRHTSDAHEQSRRCLGRRTADDRDAGPAAASRCATTASSACRSPAASSSRSTTSTGSTRPSSALVSPRTVYFLAKAEAHRDSGARPADPELRHDLGPPRRVRPRGRAADARGRPGRPGARPLRRGDAAAERACPGPCSPARRWSRSRRTSRSSPPRSTARRRWRPGNFAPVSVAWGEPMRFDGLPKGAKGYREASAEIQARCASCTTGSSRCMRSAGRGRRPRRR